MEDCVFCNPSVFGIRKLKLEDQNGYWYVVVPEEIGIFGQVLMVVRKMKEEKEHISDMSDPRLLENKERLLSIICGIHEISNMLKKRLTNQKERKVEKVYVLTQCEGRNSHLHFQFFPRYEDDLTGNEFLYSCELEEARWQSPLESSPSDRIARGKQLLKAYASLLDEGNFTYSESVKSIAMSQSVEKLNRILTRSQRK